MELIDSKKKLLHSAQVIAQSIYNMEDMPYPKETILAAIASEATMPNVDIVQIGNTVFLGHRGTGKNKSKMVGRAFNADTGQNFIKNGFKYFTYLQKRGITHYTTDFEDSAFFGAFKVFQRRARQLDTEIGIARSKNNPDYYRVYIKLGKQPLAQGI